ncbi:MAG: hypothetical protein E7057_02730 [Lentisphaerae bacterium]|nr:hypothetical protein [Lentisphaerota bacterium]
MKKNLLLLALAGVSAVLGATEVYRAQGKGDWDGRPPVSADGVFQGKANARYIAMKSFKVVPGKEYTVSGEFRLLNESRPGAFFFGTMPMNADGKRIETQYHRKDPGVVLAELAAPAAAGAKEIIIKKAPKWENSKNCPVALNAAEDDSDIPNFNTAICKAVKVSGNNLVLTLAAPLKTAFPAGTKVRRHRFGASFIYTSTGGKKLTDQWQTFSGRYSFDKGICRWAPGTAQASVVILPAGKTGTLEFRNITVTESDAAKAPAPAKVLPAVKVPQKSSAVAVGKLWQPSSAADWSGKVEFANGVFKCDSYQRTLSNATFKIQPGKKYTLSGEFRAVGVKTRQPFFFGFMPLDVNGKRIETHYYRKLNGFEMTFLAAPAAAGAKEIILKKAATWQALKPGQTYLVALNAADDDSDIPNSNIVMGTILNSGDKSIVKLNRPLAKALEANSKVRLHTYGASFIYAANGNLTDNWQKFSGTVQFDTGAVRWAPGTVQAKIVILPAGRGGTMEFRNISITEENGDLAILRDGEVNMARQSAVIEVSDSGEKAQFRPGAMYDGKLQTAWITGAAQNDHDITVHWFKKNVTVSGVWMDMTPVDYNYKKDYSYLSLLAGVVPETYKGKTTLPKEIKIEYKQYGKWHELGVFPVKGNHFFCRFSKILHDVQRLKLSFNTAPGERAAIKEFQIAGIAGNGVETLRNVPSISAHGAFFIWYPEAPKGSPQDKAITGYFRTPFTLSGKKPVAAVLSSAAYNQAEFYLNGTKLYRTPLTVSESKPKVSRFNVPLSLLKEKNVFASIADKTDMAGGMYGVIYQLAIRYADGTIQRVNSSGATTKSSLVKADNWNTQFDGFENWKPAHNRFGSGGYPGDFWSTDFSEPFFADEVELISCKLTPAIPKSGERYTLEMEFNIPKPLKHNYRVTARYGGFSLEAYADYNLGYNITDLAQSLFIGDTGKKRCVISGSWVEEITESLPVRIAVSNGKEQAFVKTKIGKMLSAPIEGQVALDLGAPAPELKPGFPKAELVNGRCMIDGKYRALIFIGANKMTGGRVADQLDNEALDMVRIHKVSVVAPPSERKAVLDTAVGIFEMCAGYTLRKNPDAKIMVVLELDPISEWLYANPDEQIELGDGSRIMGFYNNRGYGNLQVKASMASEAYRKMIYDSVHEFITRLKNHPYANSVAAVSFAAGLASENNWGVDRYNFAKGKRSRDTSLAGDFGVAARHTLIKFLAKRYQNDAQWAKAWKLEPNSKMSDLNSFEIWPHDRIQNILLWRDRPKDKFIFRDSQVEGKAFEDLAEFCSITRAETMDLAAKAVKEASDFHLITGTYAGYVFPQLINNPTGSSIYSGHAASKILRESKYFDFFSSPQWCHTLDLPNFYSVLNDSLALFGKTYVVEGDIRTHSAEFGSLYSRKEMVSQMRKITGMMLAKNFGAWFLGWSYSFAGPRGVRFFSDPALIRELKSLRIASELPPVKEPAAGNRIALLVSEHSAWHMDLMSPANTVHAMMLYKNLHKFLRTGAGCDIMALEDLPQLVKTGRLKDYKFVAFFNAFHLDKGLRSLINKEMKRDNRTLLFFYAPGYHDDEFNAGKGSSVSTAAIADLLGVKEVSMLKEAHLIGNLWNNGAVSDCSIWWDVHQKAAFQDAIGPVFWLPGNAKVEKLASLRMDGVTHTDKIGAAKIKGKDHTVVYVAVPDIPGAVLNQLVKESGTVIAADGDVTVNCGNGFLTVTNTGNDREVTLRSAYKADWIELPDNSKTASRTDTVKLPFEKFQTRSFRLIPVK